MFVSQILNPRFLALQGKHAVAIPADALKPFEKVRRDLCDLLRNRAARVKAALAAAVGSRRFIPHYALHEFETLALVSADAVDAQHARTGKSSVREQVQQVLAEADGNPELVNDSEATSPSHRLEALWPAKQYQKTVDSIGIVRRIPFSEICARCTHFDTWIRSL